MRFFGKGYKFRYGALQGSDFIKDEMSALEEYSQDQTFENQHLSRIRSGVCSNERNWF